MFRNSNRRNNFYRRNTTDWFFDFIFPKLFIGIFVIVLTTIIAQFALIGWGAYQFISNPEGTANYIGTIAGEALRPVADAVRGN